MEEFRKEVEDYVKSLLRQKEQREARSKNYSSPFATTTFQSDTVRVSVEKFTPTL